MLRTQGPQTYPAVIPLVLSKSRVAGNTWERWSSSLSYAFQKRHKEIAMNLQESSVRSFRVLSAAILVCLAVWERQVRGQEVTAGITGTVTDQSGSAMMDAILTATDMRRGTFYKARTNAEGIYYIPDPFKQLIPLFTSRSSRTTADSFILTVSCWRAPSGAVRDPHRSPLPTAR